MIDRVLLEPLKVAFCKNCGNRMILSRFRPACEKCGCQKAVTKFVRCHRPGAFKRPDRTFRYRRQEVIKQKCGV